MKTLINMIKQKMMENILEYIPDDDYMELDDFIEFPVDEIMFDDNE